MAISVAKGVLKSIGSGSVYGGEITETSVLEIGDEVLENIAYGNFIETYLRKAIQSDTPIAIAMMSNQRKKFRPEYFNEIIAVKMNGKVYEPKGGAVSTSAFYWANEFAGEKGCVVAILTVGLFGIFLLMIGWIRASYIKRARDKVLSELAQVEV